MAERRWARQTGLKSAALFVGLAVAFIGLELLSTARLTIRGGRYTPARPPDDNSGFGAKTYATMMGLPKEIAPSPSAYMDWQIGQYSKHIRMMDLAARMAQEMAANWGWQARPQ